MQMTGFTEKRKTRTFFETNSTFWEALFFAYCDANLSIERRLLTIVLMYGIITAEKEFLRSRIFDFLIASISHRNGLDHIFDHLRIRTTWKQCEREHRKAPFSD